MGTLNCTGANSVIESPIKKVCPQSQSIIIEGYQEYKPLGKFSISTVQEDKIQPKHPQKESYFQKMQREASIDNKEEICFLSEISEFSQKMEQLQLPNFTPVTSYEKGIINKRRTNLRYLLTSFNRKKAKKQFLYLVQNTKYGDPLTFNQEYSIVRDTNKCLKWYTRQCFFYKVLNIGLKVVKDPTECAYLRFPFSDTFFSILELYHKNIKDQLYIKGFKCYKGCQISQEQFNTFQNTINGYMEMEGFISTSTIFGIAYSFKKNAFITIIVPPNQQPYIFEDDYGFAFLQTVSDHPNQRQVLFNAINTFKIIKAEIRQQPEQHYYIQLQYCRVSLLKTKKELNENDRELIDNTQYQKKKLKQIKNQGCALFESEQYQKAFKWFSQSLQVLKMKEKEVLELNLDLNLNRDIIDKKKQQVHSEISQCYYMLSIIKNNSLDLEIAKQYIQKCIDFHKTEDYRYCLHLLAKAKICINLKEQRQSRTYLNKALEIAERQEYTQKCQEIKKFIFEQSKDLIQESVNEKLQNLKKGKGTSNIFYFMILKRKILLLMQEERYEEIINYGRQLLQINNKVNKNKEVYESEIYYCLSKSYFRIKNNNRGFEFLDQLMKMLQHYNSIQYFEFYMVLEIIGSFLSVSLGETKSVQVQTRILNHLKKILEIEMKTLPYSPLMKQQQELNYKQSKQNINVIMQILPKGQEFSKVFSLLTQMNQRIHYTLNIEGK